MDLAAALRVLREDPADTAVLLDFDGTLAPIVEDPAAARPLPGVAEALAALTASYGRVAVVSGRPVAFLAAHVPAAVDLVGLYGLERRTGGSLVEDPVAAAWRATVDAAVAEARRSAGEGIEVEHKGLSLTLHVRRRPERAAAARAWAEATAARTGLQARPAKMSVELHPPVAVDKGTVVEELAGDLGGVGFVGDDVGDLPAFAAVARLGAQGRRAVRVVVDSPEATPEVRASADLVVDGPAGALELLRGLVPERRG
jgi:trehalose 6-phosphate phosphatase